MPRNREAQRGRPAPAAVADGRVFFGSLDGTFYAVSLEPDEPIDEMREKLRRTLQTADQGEGVLVLTDMFGSTPSNIAVRATSRLSSPP